MDTPGTHTAHTRRDPESLRLAQMLLDIAIDIDAVREESGAAMVSVAREMLAEGTEDGGVWIHSFDCEPDADEDEYPCDCGAVYVKVDEHGNVTAVDIPPLTP